MACTCGARTCLKLYAAALRLHAAPNAAQIQQGVEWVAKELVEGRPCYIHCAHGHGRSATVLAAVLIATGQASTAEEAVGLMRWAG